MSEKKVLFTLTATKDVIKRLVGFKVLATAVFRTAIDLGSNKDIAAQVAKEMLIDGDAYDEAIKQLQKMYIEGLDGVEIAVFDDFSWGANRKSFLLKNDLPKEIKDLLED